MVSKIVCDQVRPIDVAFSFIDETTYLAMVYDNGWIRQDDQKNGIWIGCGFSYLAKYP